MDDEVADRVPVSEVKQGRATDAAGEEIETVARGAATEELNGFIVIPSYGQLFNSRSEKETSNVA
jgi:hypothetical protein